MYKLSPSRLSVFLDCPRCFWLDVNKKIKRPGGIFPTLPRGMDKVLKEHFDTHRDKKDTPEELKGKIEGHLFQDREKLKVWMNNFKGLQWADKEGNILRGAIDELFVAKGGIHVPLDFKTRGYPVKEDTHEHYQHQMDIYSFLLEKNGLKAGDFAILIFYHPIGVDRNHNVDFHAEVIKVPTDKKRALRLFQGALKCLNGPEPKPNPDCEWCGWGK